MTAPRAAVRAGRSTRVLVATLSFCVGFVALIVGSELSDPWSTWLMAGGALFAAVGLHLGSALDR